MTDHTTVTLPALSRTARDLAHEIAAQDWWDVHRRVDGARHSYDLEVERKRVPADQLLLDEEAERVRLNVAWVVAQALLREDPHLDLYAFMEECGVHPSFLRNADGGPNGGIPAGIRWDVLEQAWKADQ